jgi:hypothetical protein
MLGRSRSAERLYVLPLMAALGLLVALGLPALAGRTILRDDLASFHLPIRYLYAQALERGQSVLWFPQIYAGFYMHGEGQAGLLHPLHLLLYRTLPLVVAFNAEMLLNYVALFGGTWLFLTRLSLPRMAALCGALVFAFSGFNMMHYVHPNMVAVIAHMPWLLAAIDTVMRDADRRRVAAAQLAVGLLTASQMLLGHPQAVWLSACVEGLYALWRASESGTHVRLGRIALAKALGIAAGAVQLLPTWEAVADSPRANPTLAFRYGHALHPANLVQLVSPYLPKAVGFGTPFPHEAAIYCGAFASLVPLWLLVCLRRSEFRRLVNATLVLAALALVLALGERAYLYRLLAYLPYIGWFENAARYIVVFHFALAVGAAVVVRDLEAIFDGQPTPSWRRLSLLGMIPLTSLVVAGGAWWLRARPNLSPELAGQLAGAGPTLAGTGLMVLATALVVSAARGVRLALPMIVLLVACDQGFYGLSFLRSQYATATVDEFANGQAPPPTASAHRVQANSNMLVMRGARVAGGYEAFVPVPRLDPLDGQRLRLASVQWVQTKAPWQPKGLQASAMRNWEGRVRGAVATHDALGGTSLWAEVIDPMPRAWLASRALVSADPSRDIGAIDVASTALVPVDLGLAGGPTGTVEIVTDEPGRIRLVATAPSRQILILSESWHRGWEVIVDGVAHPVVRAFGDFMGCVLETGRHDVEFRFRPWSFRAGVCVSLAGLSLMCAMFAVARRTGRDVMGIARQPYAKGEVQ